MAMHYLNPKDASDPGKLPNLEVWEHHHIIDLTTGGRKCVKEVSPAQDEDGECLGPGWYWQSCFPECLPDSEPMGPFETEQEALEDAREDLNPFTGEPEY